MGGFFGWFLVFIGVLAIFNAEKLPALRQMLEEKFKGSLDIAKEVSKNTKTKIEKVKTEIDNKKTLLKLRQNRKKILQKKQQKLYSL